VLTGSGLLDSTVSVGEAGPGAETEAGYCVFVASVVVVVVEVGAVVLVAVEVGAVVLVVVEVGAVVLVVVEVGAEAEVEAGVWD